MFIVKRLLMKILLNWHPMRYLVTVLVLFGGTWSLFVKYSFDLFYHFQDWLELEEAIQSGPVLGFGKKISSILEKYFSE